MKKLILLFILFFSCLALSKTCQDGLQACDKTLGACKALVKAQDVAINHLNEDLKATDEELAQNQAKSRKGIAASIAYLGAAGAGAAVGGPVGALIGTGIVGIIDLFGGF